MLPGWREDPTLVLALVRMYVEQDTDAPPGAHAEAVEARNQRVGEVRRRDRQRGGPAPVRLLARGARRAQQGFEDHNYKIDSRRPRSCTWPSPAAPAGSPAPAAWASPADIWFLHAHEVALALRDLAARDEGPGPLRPWRRRARPQAPANRRGQTVPCPPHWRALVARDALHH